MSELVLRPEKFYLGVGLKCEGAECVQRMREAISRRFHVHEALKRDPHITLIPPFFTNGGAAPLAVAVERSLQGQSSFVVDIIGFGFCDESIQKKEDGSPGSGAVFLDVRKDDRLDVIRDALGNALQSRDMVVTVPDAVPYHATLAYKDLTPDILDGIKLFLGTRLAPTRYLVIDNVTLYAKVNKKWETVRVFPLA